MKFGTKAIHKGIEPDKSTGAIMTPVYQTSTYVQKAPGEHMGFEYSRSQNPTRQVLETNIAALEDGKHGFTFASGMSAIDTIMKLLKPGEEVIACNDLYGGSYRIFKHVFESYGIKFHFVDMHHVERVKDLINDRTKMLWVETPTNPLLKIIDLKTIGELSKESGLLMVVDNTFATPYLQLPLEFGADIVVHSVTKYIGGHSDVIMGAIIVNRDDLAERIGFLQNACGAVPSPMDCFLVLRGIKTLHLRMDRHCKNAETVANFLMENELTNNVYYPGFSTHPNHEVATTQMHNYGGMVSFDLKEDTLKHATSVLQKFKIFSLAESLGGVESLCGHPATMTHASIPEAERLKVGITNSLIRLSVGIEDGEDLIADLEQAFK